MSLVYGMVTTLTGYPRSLVRLVDAAFIPDDINNIDYQAYLEWVALGNTAPNMHARYENGVIVEFILD